VNIKILFVLALLEYVHTKRFFSGLLSVALTV